MTLLHVFAQLLTLFVFAGESTYPAEHTTKMINALSKQANLEEQIMTLMHFVCPQFPNIAHKYMHLCQDLEGILRTIVPNCTVQRFGSTITGLCFQNSDVDAYVKLPYQNFNITTLINKSKYALGRSRLFTDVFAIPKAKTPIVKCVHIPTGLSCDFNFKNMLGVCNSHLITYYLTLDIKLTTIMIVIKYWAKVADLSGVNKFSNYSLVLLFIFYLQQEYCFPSVAELQADKSCWNIQGNWNGGFKPLENYRNEKIASASLETVLCGFFKFCANFNYASYVVCPYTGKAIPKIAFFRPEALPDVFERYKVNGVPLHVEKFLCIQDPFEHSHNTTSGLPFGQLEDFVAYCKLAVEIFEHSEPKNILSELITREPPNAADTIVFTDTTLTFKFRMGNLLQVLYDKIEKTDDFTSMLNKMQSAWYEIVNEFIISVLIRILKLQVLLCKSEDGFAKSQKLNDSTDVHDTEITDSVTFHCSGKQNLWGSRKQKDVNLEGKSGILETQAALTESICSSIANVPLTENIIEFELTFNVKRNAPEAEFFVKKIAAVNKGVFNSLCAFFSTKVTHWFEVYTKELNDEAKTKCQSS